MKKYCVRKMRALLSLSFLLMMLGLGGTEVWGQEKPVGNDFSGTYYIANYHANSYSSTSNTDNYYLCPSGVYYDYNGDPANQMPYLTTHKPDPTNRPNEPISKWKIVYASTDNNSGVDYYYIKYVAPDGNEMYMVHNEQIVSGNADRVRLHLQSNKDATDENNNLFSFTPGTKGDKKNLNICPKASANSNRSLNPAKANTDSYTGVNTNSPGSFKQGNTTIYCGGLIGYYDSNDDRGLWYLEDIVKNPVVSINSDGNAEISSSNASATYYYTTDGTTTPTTGSTQYIAPIDITGVETIKAIAVVNGESSNVATYTVGTGMPYLIQNQECTAYYMVPGDPSAANVTANTSSIAGPKMEWYVRDAGAVNGLQYYYIINKSSSTSSSYSYLYRTGDNINVQNLSNKLPGDEYKFYLRSNTDGSFNVYPKDVYDKSLYKNSGNIEANNIGLNKDTRNNLAKWNFIPTSNYADKRSLFETMPTLESPDENGLHFYKIESYGTPGSYIVVTDNSDYAGTSSSETARNMSWELQIADHDDWLNYYHIRSAATGQYMYFTGDTEPVNTNNKTNAVEMKDLSSEEAERYQFVLARATYADYYYIIPKSHKNVFKDQKYYSIWNNTEYLQATLNRSSNGINVKWKFEDADLFCVDPVITRDDSNGEITITCVTNTSDIFYTTNNDTPVLPANAETAPTAHTNKYAVSFLPEVGVTQIKAQAVVKNDYTVSSSAVTYDLSEYTQPTITYDYENNTITISTDEGARVYYSYGSAPSDPTIDPNVATQTFTTDAITSTTVVKALAVKEGWAPSEIITMTVYKPTIELSASTATYNNTDLSPTITVKNGDDVFDAAKYTVSFQKGGEAMSECKDAGTYTVIVSDVEGDNEIVSGTTTFTIAPKELTITPDDNQSKELGDDDPQLTYSKEGIVDGDEWDEVLSGELSRDEGENVGTYTIYQGTLTANSNYTIAFTDGKIFTITGKSIGDGETPANGITIEIVKNDDDSFTTTVRNNGQNMTVGTEGTDYDYSITSSGDASTKYYEVTITGANNYSGGFKAKYANIALTKADDDTTPGGACTFATNSSGDGDIATPDNMTAYIVTAVNSNTVTIEVVDYIPEDMPVLLLSNVNAKGFQVQPRAGGEDVTDEQKADNLLKVETADRLFNMATIYLLYKGEFVLNAEGTLAAGKIYLPNPNAPDSNSGSRGESRLKIIRSESTGIEDTHLSSSPLSEFWYSLDGQRLSGKPSQKGLYLQNRKKIVIK